MEIHKKVMQKLKSKGLERSPVTNEAYGLGKKLMPILKEEGFKSSTTGLLVQCKEVHLDWR